MSMPSLQSQIRALFRRGMRAVEKADRHVVVDAFREHMGVPRKSFQRSEYLMRKGERQIDLIERAVGVADVRWQSDRRRRTQGAVDDAGGRCH